MASSTASPTEHCVCGIGLSVWNLEAARRARSIACVFVLHGRGSARDSVAWIADRLAAVHVPDRTLLVVTLDHRNHGARLVDDKANLSWRNSRGSDEVVNPSHAQDMVAIQLGTAQDVSGLIDSIPAVLFPDATSSPPIEDWIVVGISLGGHSTWIVGAQDPRVRCIVPIIGSPDSERLLRARAAGLGIPFSPPYAPAGLLDLLGRKDPCHAPATVWAGKHILVLGGGKDRLVPHVDGGAEDFVERLKQEGRVGSVEVFVQPEMGHQCTQEMVDRLCAWLPRRLQSHS